LEKPSKGDPIVLTDADCINVIKKMIASNIECETPEENEILEIFLPKQLTEDDIRCYISAQQFTTIGDCMKYFKENFAGLYNGKEVSKIFNSK